MLLSYCLFPPHLFLNVPLFPALVPHLSSRKTYNRPIYSPFHEYRFSNQPEFSEEESLPTEKRPFPAHNEHTLFVSHRHEHYFFGFCLTGHEESGNTLANAQSRASLWRRKRTLPFSRYQRHEFTGRQYFPASHRSKKFPYHADCFSPGNFVRHEKVASLLRRPPQTVQTYANPGGI